VRTLHSLAASDYPDFDVVVVDQSAGIDSPEPLTSGNRRVTYIQSSTRGASAAHNIALSHASGPIVAFTDDDCEPASDWLTRLVRYFGVVPTVGIVCGAVVAGPHDPHLGYIPSCAVSRLRRISTPWGKWRDRGMGANMAFRLEALQAAGVFDPLLGPGSPLHACLDGDMAYRILRAGYTLLDVPDAYVVHHGYRTWEQGSYHMRACGVGVASAYTKHLRLGDLAILPTLMIEWARCISWGRLLRLQRRSGIGRFLAFGRGMLASFRYPIDARTCTYIAH
jgi:GT2 family glycosyltransferase